LINQITFGNEKFRPWQRIMDLCNPLSRTHRIYAPEPTFQFPARQQISTILRKVLKCKRVIEETRHDHGDIPERRGRHRRNRGALQRPAGARELRGRCPFWRIDRRLAMFSNMADSFSPTGFGDFSLASTAAQPITPVTITTPNAGVNGWDFFVDTITITTGSVAPGPEPSSALLLLSGAFGIFAA